MADHTISISNRITPFGPAPSTKWGTGSPYTMTWGVSKWGEGTQDLTTESGKFLAETISISCSLEISADFNVFPSNSIEMTNDMSSESLQIGTYYYVFPGPTTEAESSNRVSFTSGSRTTLSYTSIPAGGTSWS